MDNFPRADPGSGRGFLSRWRNRRLANRASAGVPTKGLIPLPYPGAECLRLKRRKGEGRADARGSGDVDLGVFPANARTR